MLKPMLTICLVGLLLAGCQGTTIADKTEQTTSDTTGTSLTPGSWQVTVVTDQLNYPWEIRAANGGLIITEATGSIVMIDSSRNLRRFAVQTSRPVVHDGGSGLMRLALATNFTTTGIAYVYYTYNSGSGLTNRIAELRSNGTSWVETRVLLDGIPGHQLYNGGRLALGPDGYLYATTGWLHDTSVSQNLRSLAGKILRLTVNGQPAEGNPFPASYIYSYGHRNPQGLAWNAAGQLYASEHGESGHDEINIITPGGNYGWPIIQGDERQSPMLAPYIQSGSNAWAPSGIAFAGDQLLVATLATRSLYAVNDARKTLEPIFNAEERLRAVLPYRNGLYLISTNTSPRATGRSGIADRLLWLQSKE